MTAPVRRKRKTARERDREAERRVNEFMRRYDRIAKEARRG